jgi:hypothetical protein
LLCSVSQQSHIQERGPTNITSKLARPAGYVALPGCVLQASLGYYVTAVDGGGRTTDTIHSDTTRAGSWEDFTITRGH